MIETYVALVMAGRREAASVPAVFRAAVLEIAEARRAAVSDEY